MRTILILIMIALTLAIFGCVSQRDPGREVTSVTTVTTHLDGTVAIKYVDVYNDEEFQIHLGSKDEYELSVVKDRNFKSYPRFTRIEVLMDKMFKYTNEKHYDDNR